MPLPSRVPQPKSVRVRRIIAIIRKIIVPPFWSVGTQPLPLDKPDHFLFRIARASQSDPMPLSKYFEPRRMLLLEWRACDPSLFFRRAESFVGPQRPYPASSCGIAGAPLDKHLQRSGSAYRECRDTHCPSEKGAPL